MPNTENKFNNGYQRVSLYVIICHKKAWRFSFSEDFSPFNRNEHRIPQVHTFLLFVERDKLNSKNNNGLKL